MASSRVTRDPVDKIQRSKFKHEMAPAIRLRDNFKCLICGKKGNIVHHIKPWATNPELRFDPLNSATLCRDCHWTLAHGEANNSIDLTVAEWLTARVANEHDTEKWRAILLVIQEKKEAAAKFQIPDTLWGKARRRVRRRLQKGWPHDLALSAPIGYIHIRERGSPSPETRRKQSIAHLGQQPTNLAQLIAINTGRHPSAGTHAKIAKAKLGNKHGAGNRGKKHSPETVAKMRKRRHTPETRARMSAAKRANPVRYWLGKKRTENAIKVSLALKGVPWSPARRAAQEAQRLNV